MPVLIVYVLYNEPVAEVFVPALHGYEDEEYAYRRQQESISAEAVSEKIRTSETSQAVAVGYPYGVVTEQLL